MSERPEERDLIQRFLAQHSDLPSRETTSGIPIQLLYGQDADGIPGEHPYLRGVHPTMYRGRPWTMRQYAGFGSARETNRRFRYLLEEGQTGLSVAFDLPTQMGYDPDHELALPEVGKVGVSIACLTDMLELLDGISLDRVSTSMTINSTAIILLALYAAVAREQGVAASELAGTIQNDILKEYAARGTYRFPIEPSLRLVTDVFAHTSVHMPRFNPISISGYHMREAGCTAAQEIGFTLANGIAYVQAALDAGLDVDRFARRLSFFFASHNHLFEEVAKFRAARRMWAEIMVDRFGATDPRSSRLRFHTQTGGSTLTSQQYENNVVRVTMQALAAVLGGTQSLHTNSRDEALSLPSESSARIALRTQQILASESGVCDTVDPLGGSPYVESLTAELERKACEYISAIDGLGGSPAAIKHGYIQREIMKSAYRHQQALESGEAQIVGVNVFLSEEEEASAPRFSVDEQVTSERIETVARLRDRRESGPVQDALAGLEKASRGRANLFQPVLRCVESQVTLGEICTTLGGVFGRYKETPVL